MTLKLKKTEFTQSTPQININHLTKNSKISKTWKIAKIQTDRKSVSVPSLPPSNLTNMAINYEEISQVTVSKLCQVADWMESRTAQQSKNIARRNNNEKTRGKHIIRLFAYFPERAILYSGGRTIFISWNASHVNSHRK
jgi:hypothetical protein